MLSDIPAGSEWFKLSTYKEATRTTLVSTEWFFDANFFFYSAQEYYTNSNDVGPKYYDVSAWDRKPNENGVMLAVSNLQVLYFDFSYQKLQLDLNVSYIGDGKVKVEVFPLPYPSIEQAWRWFNTTRLFTFMVMSPRMNADGSWAVDTQDMQVFDYKGDAFTQSPLPYYIHQGTMPSVTFVALYSARNGKYGNSWAQHGNGLGTWLTPYWKQGYFQPWAIIQPYSNGSLPALPPSFKGDVVILPGIPGDRRLPIVRNNITIFHGVTINFPLTEFGCSNPRQFNPIVFQFAVPTCLQLMNASPFNRNWYKTYDVVSSTDAWCASFGPLYRCWQLVRMNGVVDWSWLNQVLSVSFDTLQCDSQSSPFVAYMRPVLTVDGPHAQWQQVNMTIAKLSDPKTDASSTLSYER